MAGTVEPDLVQLCVELSRLHHHDTDDHGEDHDGAPAVAARCQDT